MAMKLRRPQEAGDNIDFRIEALAREITGFSPQVVSDACDEWCRTSAFWPALAEILPILRDYQRLADAPKQPRGRQDGSKVGIADRLQALLHMGWPATRIAPLCPDASQYMLNHPDLTDAEIIGGLQRLEDGRSPKLKAEKAPPIGKPMAKAVELCRNQERFLEAPRLISMYLAMVERFHGRGEAEYQAGQLSVGAQGQAAEALRPYMQGAMA